MKKLTYLFLALLIVACSDDEGNPCVYNVTDCNNFSNGAPLTEENTPNFTNCTP